MSFYRLVRPFLFALGPESAHRLAVWTLAGGWLGGAAPPADPRLATRLLGLDFPNPIGMAAGFDKNGEVPGALHRLGFGFVEIGTVTPLPQAGNPRPRMFRLTADRAVINRLGFNNEGHEAVLRRLKARQGGGILGLNIGANKDSADRIADYALGVERFAKIADYLTVNISSPNTPGLRDLQEKAALMTLLEAVVTARAGAAGARPPILLKIAPDLDDAALGAIAEAALASGIDGIIVSNTTLSRERLTDTRLASEAGGLSGRPLFRRSTVMLAKLRRIVGRGFVLIGVGGVDSADAAFAKIAAGANLVQFYTGLIYQGPGLAAEIVRGLSATCDRLGLETLADAVGGEADKWANSAHAATIA